ncbi:MAG: peptide-methionine (R)-S-oxide reductase MsrB [Nitrospira sp.]|nr:peptide-methionine (R)-S-oxide reductase MsrB [Candidatus Manganitrophaceae bacterium]
MNRRVFMMTLGVYIGSLMIPSRVFSKSQRITFKQIIKTDKEWRKLLRPDRYEILRREGTERRFSSPLDKEYGPGVYVCAGCALELFTSEMKYDSKTGWPSFFRSIEGRLETKIDFKMLFPRTEYHCARCDGHQGHIFNDGPKPSGKRWCNNGLALKFIAAKDSG